MKRHDVYLTALAQRNRLRREAEEKNEEQKRKMELERGFSTYINGANTRAKSAGGQRTLSRVGTASSSKTSPEPRMKAMSAVGTSRTRKSWAENMLEKENGPFFNQRESSEEDGIAYSQSFEDEERIESLSSTPEMQESSSLESVEERMQTPSSSREFVVPQLSACTARSGRRGWNLNSSIPFATLQVSSTAFSDASKSSLETVSTSSSPSPELQNNSISTGDVLRAKSQKRRNILEESWNLIDDFERNNKGRSSLIFSASFSEEPDSSSVVDLEEEPYSDVIPVSPSGQILELIVHSTWGDQNYVGLNGLELWNTKGETIKISSISSKDFKVNKLDPRSKLGNIVNGNYNTSDDLQTWVAELAKRKSKITIEFERVQKIAMIRVWNYNRNRVHAKRGVRHLEMKLDQKVIFSNEIVCGQGDKSTPAVEPIIFTTEEEVFDRIAQNDPVFPKN